MENISLFTEFLLLLFWFFLGYIGGSIPFAYITAMVFKGVDIRTFGSGNVGATNLGRLMGKKWAVFVTIADMLKGGLLVLMARYYGMPDVIIATTAFAAVCGHNYPVWLNFRGGKGVSTTYGTLFFVDPLSSCLAVPLAGLTWLVGLRVIHYVSVSSIISLTVIAILFFLFGMSGVFSCLAIALALLSAWRHRANFVRIKEGKESTVYKNDL